MILLLMFLSAEGFHSQIIEMPAVACLQRKLPEQDIAQGSYIALPLTLLLLLAGYNHDKVGQGLLLFPKYHCPVSGSVTLC